MSAQTRKRIPQIVLPEIIPEYLVGNVALYYTKKNISVVSSPLREGDDVAGVISGPMQFKQGGIHPWIVLV